MLTGRTILVTGGARGLGQVLALGCADHGAHVIVADIDIDGARDTAAQIVAKEGAATSLHVDLGNPESIYELAEQISVTHGSLHGLVNNAAIATGIGGIAFEDIELDSWEQVQRVNVRGTWLMVKACAPLLRKSRSGRIVNVASDTALWGAPRLMSYVASKGAVISMTRSLARELGPDRVGVTAVAPGILTTSSTDYVPAERHQLYGDGRAVPGPQSPQDIAGVVAFLVSEDALTLTGQIMPVNNGFVFN
ncbi:SDR family oxidoreductase [Ochrobactrum sp. GPK 3]|uniref:SDR family oxidoreductase n=1 Tax=Brucella sp. 22210 TaxID=3453892 RepID=UPI0031385657